REIRPDGEHYITRLVAPAQGNTAVPGLDVVAQPDNLAGLLRSRDDDRTALSAPFRLLQQADDEPADDGITLRLPVYSSGKSPQTVAERRARVRGSIALSFRASGLIGSAVPAETLQALHVQVSDVTGTDR